MERPQQHLWGVEGEGKQEGVEGCSFEGVVCSRSKLRWAGFGGRDGGVVVEGHTLLLTLHTDPLKRLHTFSNETQSTKIST